MEDGGRGDFYINIKIALPKNITKEEEKIYKQLQRLALKDWFT